MFSLTIVSPTYQTIETTPIQIVDGPGVRKRGWIRPQYFGIAPCTAIERLVREVGRIVVCVDADAEVSTAMIRSLSQGEPRTSVPSALSTSSELSTRNWGPWNAWAAIETIT